MFIGLSITTAKAEQIRIAVSLSIPPFFIMEIENGIELEIIRAAFAYRGHDVLPIFYFSGPRLEQFNRKKEACASSISANSNVKAHYSDPFITLENVVITLSKNALKIDNLEHLKNLKIITYKGASKVLGKEFAKNIKGNLHYRERLKNEIMPLLLFRGRVQAVISDLTIFHYVSHKMSKRVDINQPIDIHRIFPKKQLGIACHSHSLINDFNAGLNHLKQRGELEHIWNKYTKDYFKE